MKEKIFYSCEVCNKTFDSEEECKEHEKNCGKTVTIRFYMVSNFVDNTCNELRVSRTVFENSKYTDDGCIIINTSRKILPKIKIENCDRVYSDMSYNYIYALNKDEKTCINELMNEKREYMKECIELYKKEIDKIDNIEKTLKIDNYISKYEGKEIFENSFEV